MDTRDKDLDRPYHYLANIAPSYNWSIQGKHLNIREDATIS